MQPTAILARNRQPSMRIAITMYAAADQRAVGRMLVKRLNMLFKVYDKQRKEFWEETFTLLDLAKSNRFPSNAEKFYEIVPVESAQHSVQPSAAPVCKICSSPAVGKSGYCQVCE